MGYRLIGQSVELFGTRPDWLDPEVRWEHPFAKATYLRAADCWRVFWMRADLKWHGYAPQPEVNSLAEFLEVVDDDAFCCVFG
jgi:hypothetical protein